jgi:hypothetical protein
MGEYFFDEDITGSYTSENFCAADFKLNREIQGVS